MEQEEKLEEAKRLYKTANADQRYVLERLFPELAESEDEMIRNWLIDTIKQVPNDSIEWDAIDKSSVLAWLEKQGEHKRFRDSIQIGDEVTRNKDGVIVNISQLKRKAKKDNGIPKPSFDEAQGTPIVEKMSDDWSEKDDVTLIETIKLLKDPSLYVACPNLKEEVINWLKNLKPQSTWKPSNEQMVALEYYMHALVCNEHKEILFGLYADLKKLRE